ncbi:hypothetical protein G6F57_018483 [Rhizopus arrhizus]|nr:hypothetical protein G6F57_018483 [Rhizopus arrhizus]
MVVIAFHRRARCARGKQCRHGTRCHPFQRFKRFHVVLSESPGPEHSAANPVKFQQNLIRILKFAARSRPASARASITLRNDS